MSFLFSSVDFWPQMGLFGAPRGMILESFLRRPCRVGSSGRPGHRKIRFLVHLGGPLEWFGGLLGYFGHIFQYTFCRYEVVWVSCLQGSFPRDVTGHSIIFWHIAVQESHTQENWQSRSVFSSRDGFLRIHDATAFVFIQSQLAPHFIAFRHCRPHGSLFDILYNLKWSHASMVLLYLATLSLGSLNCMVWHPFNFAWDSFMQRDVI